MEPAPKKRKIAPRRNVHSLAAADKVPLTQVVGTESKVQQAKKLAVKQAQQEGCLGNYRSFDSAFGNYLVPVVPTHADLFG